ncbi:MAG: hypothetical protein V1717_04490 [Candidatus Micrarchaeota archaeon]
MDWTMIMEWDELLIVAGVAMMLFVGFEIGFWVALVGTILFLATEGYLNF